MYLCEKNKVLMLKKELLHYLEYSEHRDVVGGGK
jgi:hypothetical protein